jgi:hypothetical protein
MFIPEKRKEEGLRRAFYWLCILEKDSCKRMFFLFCLVPVGGIGIC